MRRLGHVLRLLLRGRRVEAELDEELRAYVDLLTNQNLQAGMSPTEARRAALIECEGLEQLKEKVREVRMGAGLESFGRDLQYGLRMVRRNPGFTAAAVLTLALGIGVNAGIFSLVDAVLLAPLPYDRPQALTLVWSTFQKMGASRAPTSGFGLRQIKDRSHVFADLAGIWVGNGTLTGEGNPEQIKVAFVTANFFPVLGAHPVLGRSFTTDEQGLGGRRAVVLSDALWRRRYGADPRIVGQTIQYEGGAITVAGVMPAGFQLLFPADSNVPLNVQAWVPFPYDIDALPRDLYYIRILGRLKPGVTLEQAQADTDSVARQMRSEFREFGAENLKLEVSPLHRDSVRDMQPALLALFAGASLVLLIACVNVGNLLLTRASARRKEIAVRASFGASRGRILRQLFAESLVLCALGGALGVAIGFWGVSIVLPLKPAGLARLRSVELNLPVLGFVSAISLASAVLFGLAPMLESAKLNLIETLRTAGRGTAASAGRWMRRSLIVGEITLAFLLLIGAGLMIRTFAALQRVNPGFQASRVLTFEIELPGGRYQRNLDRNNFVTQWEEKLAALAGVVAAGSVSHLPLDDYPNWYSPYTPEGTTEAQTRNMLADYRSVTPGYFTAMGSRLVGGRLFDKQDKAATRNVVIVDTLLANTAWPNQDAVGKKIKAEHYLEGNFVEQWAEVVGVVEHIRHHSLAKELRGQIYIPYTQSSRPHQSFTVKVKGDPLALIEPIRRELHGMDKDLALSKIRPMTEYVAQAKAPASFTALLAGVFGGMALLLAAIGVYAVVSYSVSQRIHELGVRMALGAGPGDLLRLVFKEGLALTAVGMVLGLAGARALSRYLQTLLFGITPADPATYITVTAVVFAAAMAACWRPARRAASGNPLEAIRGE